MNQDTIGRDTIIKSIELCWNKSDQEVVISAVLVNPFYHTTPFASLLIFTKAYICVLFMKLYNRFFSAQPPTEFIEHTYDVLVWKGMFQGLMIRLSSSLRPHWIKVRSKSANHFTWLNLEFSAAATRSSYLPRLIFNTWSRTGYLCVFHLCMPDTLCFGQFCIMREAVPRFRKCSNKTSKLNGKLIYCWPEWGQNAFSWWTYQWLWNKRPTETALWGRGNTEVDRDGFQSILSKLAWVDAVIHG